MDLFRGLLFLINDGINFRLSNRGFILNLRLNSLRSLFHNFISCFWVCHFLDLRFNLFLRLGN